jgi:hypothetical protein
LDTEQIGNPGKNNTLVGHERKGLISKKSFGAAVAKIGELKSNKTPYLYPHLPVEANLNHAPSVFNGR